MWNRHHGGEIEYLISKKKYPKAIKLLRSRIHENPDNVFLQQQLAEVLSRTGERNEALGILNRLVEDFAREGFASKAIAVLKKMQRINPGLESLEQRIADMVHGRGVHEAQATGAGAGTAPTTRTGLDESVPILDANSLEIELSNPAGEREPEPQERVFLNGPALSPLFNDFTADQLLAVIQGLNLLNFDSGEIVCSEGESGSSMFLLAGGLLRVFVRNARGRNNQVRLLETGAFFGEISLISKEPRSATIVCAAPCEILELDMDTLKSISRQHPKVPHIIHDFYKRRRNSPEEQQART